MFTIMDNASTHSNPPGAQPWAYKDLLGFEMSHTIWVFLPKNTTSHIQPLDQGIIAAMKARYRSRQVQWVISEAERDPPTPNAQVDLRLAIIWLSDSFKEVCAETIRNCWAHAGILPVEDELSIRQVKTRWVASRAEEEARRTAKSHCPG